MHPSVVTAMREVGIDLSGITPVKLSDELGRWADVVVTMGCGDSCPVIPGKRYIDWELPDPKDMPVEKVRDLREDIELRVNDLVQTLDQTRQ